VAEAAFHQAAEEVADGLWNDAGQSPETETLQRLDSEAMQRMIAKLPNAFREAIVLREINDLSYREIADVTGVPVGTVMSRLARARQRLKQYLVAHTHKEAHL